MNKVLLVGLLVVALVLAGCNTPWMSNNSASDNDTSSWSKDRTSDTDILSENTVKLIDVSVDSRDFSQTTIEISSPCPAATMVLSGSCNVEVK